MADQYVLYGGSSLRTCLPGCVVRSLSSPYFPWLHFCGAGLSGGDSLPRDTPHRGIFKARRHAKQTVNI